MKLPELIAEIGVQHFGDVEAAKTLIASAAHAGADVVKFQAYRADWITTRDAKPYWDTEALPAETQWDYFKRTEALPIEEYAALANYAKVQGVEFMVTAFDEGLVDQLDPLVKRWKIASGDITHEALVRHIASKGKPVLLSTGASEMDEIATALGWLDGVPVTLLHCVLAYPTHARQANLLAIPALKERFPSFAVGWSDHVSDRSVVPYAWMLGAEVIEKHYSLMAGGDAFHAWTPQSLRHDREEIAQLSAILGRPEKVALKCEEAARVGARRSQYLVGGEPRMLRPAK